ncbi:MAG: hypothetical protein JXR96_03480 [Deltaproteobacteria bacterium]|nr:hypothetical protein [Deltaproteobacteria bacterium]
MFRVLWTLVAICSCLLSCMGSEQVKPAENKFYKSPHVRRCLQYEKEHKASESKHCWAELLRRVESEPGFRQKAELSDSDIVKIRQKSGQSDERSHGLNRELNRCFNIPSLERDRRVACLKAYLAKHDSELTMGERYEIQNAIDTTLSAKEIASGNVEATIEHAGKLLGAELHIEDDMRVRIDAVLPGLLAMAQCPAQGLILAVDDISTTDMDATEIISRLEACEERPIQLTVRHGAMEEVVFYRIEAFCGQDRNAKRIWRVALEPSTCTGPDSPELALGIAWCYRAAEGVLQVAATCPGSAAEAAGVKPGHDYVRINDQIVLGKTYPQITTLLESGEVIRFYEKAGALHSPAPLERKKLDEAGRQRCWQAIENLHKEKTRRRP